MIPPLDAAAAEEPSGPAPEAEEAQETKPRTCQGPSMRRCLLLSVHLLQALELSLLVSLLELELSDAVRHGQNKLRIDGTI